MKGATYAALRRRLGLTQAQLAKLLGIHKQTVSDRERGKNRITREAQLAITHPKVRGETES